MSEASSAPRVGLGVKLSYGVGAIVSGVSGLALGVNFYLIRVIGMNPIVVGQVILVSLIIDAVLDPLIGRFSDTLRTRWGRRHPLMYLSAIPIALAIVFLWNQPAGLAGAGLAAYVLAMLIVVRLAGGLYQIPSDALTPELAPDYHARTGLISYRWFFGIVGGTVMGLILNVVYLRKDKSHPLGQLDKAAYGHFAILLAIVVFACIMISSLATHRYIPRLSNAPSDRKPLGASLREVWVTLANPSLIVVIVSGVVSGVAGGITAALGSFMNYYFWGLTPQVIGLMGAVAAPAAIVGVVLAPILSRALDKKRTMITVFLMSIFSGVIPVVLRLLNLMPANGSPWIPVILVADAFFAGTLALIGFVIVSSMIADIVEDSAVKTGVRSEGLLFAANGLLPKITGGVGNLIGNIMLVQAQVPVGAPLTAHDVVDPAIMRHLVLLSLPAGLILNLIATGVLIFYRIDRRSHESNLAALALEAGLGGPAPTSVPAGPPQVVDPTAIRP